MNKRNYPTLSIIIPVFNEEKTIGIVLDKLHNLKLAPVKKELIVVDDGSSDKTAQLVKERGKKNSAITFIQHTKNKGKGEAVKTGIKKASGEILIIQDADLEYNPKDIGRLIDPILKDQVQVVYGTRLRRIPVLFGKNRTPMLLHFFGNKFLSLITTVLYGSYISDMETGYKAFRREVVKDMKIHARSFEFEPEITAKILKRGYKILELDIDVNPRGYDEGKKIKAGKDGAKALWALVKYRFTN